MLFVGGVGGGSVRDIGGISGDSRGGDGDRDEFVLSWVVVEGLVG